MKNLHTQRHKLLQPSTYCIWWMHNIKFVPSKAVPWVRRLGAGLPQRRSGFDTGPVHVNFAMRHEFVIISAVLLVSERQTSKLEICQRKKCFFPKSGTNEIKFLSGQMAWDCTGKTKVRNVIWVHFQHNLLLLRKIR